MAKKPPRVKAKPKKPARGGKRGKPEGGTGRAAGRTSKSSGTRRPSNPPRKRSPRSAPPSGRPGRTKPRLSRVELRRRLDTARGAAARGEPLVKRWMRGLEFGRDHLTDIVGRQVNLRAKAPPVAAKGTPWALVARYNDFDSQLTYTELHRALERWDGDDRIRHNIGARRISRMTVLYDGVETYGGTRRVTREFTLAEIAPWDVMVARALERTDPTSEESLVARYDSNRHRTRILALYVWLALDEAKEATWIPN